MKWHGQIQPIIATPSINWAVGHPSSEFGGLPYRYQRPERRVLFLEHLVRQEWLRCYTHQNKFDRPANFSHIRWLIYPGSFCKCETESTGLLLDDDRTHKQVRSGSILVQSVRTRENSLANNRRRRGAIGLHSPAVLLGDKNHVKTTNSPQTEWLELWLHSAA